MRRALAVLVLVGVPALVAAGGRIATTTAQAPPRLIFASDRAPDYNAEVYSLDLGGGARSDLSRDELADTVVAVHGRQVLFESDRSGLALYDRPRPIVRDLLQIRCLGHPPGVVRHPQRPGRPAIQRRRPGAVGIGCGSTHMATPSDQPIRARSEPAASITARTSSIRVSSVGAPSTRSDMPVPRLSKIIRWAKLPSRSNSPRMAGTCHAISTAMRHSRRTPHRTDPRRSFGRAMLTSPPRTYRVCAAPTNLVSHVT